MTKLYIKTKTEKGPDGEKLLIVETYASKPAQPYQIIWVR